jgi:undecaprenyl-diphosphatase
MLAAKVQHDEASTGPGATDHHPREAARVLVLGYVGLVVAMLAIGLVLTHVLDHSVGAWDTDVNRWFARRRSDGWTWVTSAVTFMLDTGPVIGVALVTVLLFSWRRRISEALVIGVGLVLEITVFLSVTFVVARPRPAVPRLSSTPMTSSFPSGHTAAAVVLYGGIAVGISCCTRARLLRVGAWCFAVTVVLGVALSRVYRGMHHPTDVAAGAVFGAACLWIACHAVRTYFGPDEATTAGTPVRAPRVEPVGKEAVA